MPRLNQSHRILQDRFNVGLLRSSFRCVRMKSQKKSFMVEDILGLRSEENASHLKQGKGQEYTDDEELVVGSSDNILLERNTCRGKVTYFGLKLFLRFQSSCNQGKVTIMLNLLMIFAVTTNFFVTLIDTRCTRKENCKGNI